MVAILFIAIAFFGYVALHARLLHSGQKLEEKEVIRSATDFYSAILVSRAALGMNAGPDGKPFLTVVEVPGMMRIDTTHPRDLAWITENIAYPKSFAEGMEETMQLSPTIMATPYSYSWEKR